MSETGWFTDYQGVRRHGVRPPWAGDDNWTPDERRLVDYFQTPEFRLRHARQHLRTIAQALNALEKEGWELKEGEFSLSAAYALPFGHNGLVTPMDEMPTNLVVSYDSERLEWRTDEA